MLSKQHLLLLVVVLCCGHQSSTLAWTPPLPAKTPVKATSSLVDSGDTHTSSNQRRAFCRETAAAMAAGILLTSSYPVLAQPAEFQNLGTQTPAVRPEDPPFTTLPNGVKIADFSVGQGDPVPASNARVSVQANGRLLNLNGVSFYNTKNNNPDGFGAIPLTITLGQGQALPGLEAGIVGMRKNGIRRIVIPAELAYSQYPDLEPQPMSDLDRRALDSVIKNPRRDATIMFDVKLERFK